MCFRLGAGETNIHGSFISTPLDYKRAPRRELCSKLLTASIVGCKPCEIPVLSSILSSSFCLCVLACLLLSSHETFRQNVSGWHGGARLDTLAQPHFAWHSTKITNALSKALQILHFLEHRDVIMQTKIHYIREHMLQKVPKMKQVLKLAVTHISFSVRQKCRFH